MKVGYQWTKLVGGSLLTIGFACVAHATLPEIVVLSNRADLISGGDALVEIKVPAYFNPAFGVKVSVDGRSVTSAFAKRSDGRFYGLVTGLQNGDNVLTATTPVGRARITITNHPIGGPVISGAQIQPWICATDRFGLAPAVDAQCNAPTVYRWMYRTTSNTFATYDPANPPPASSIKMTTTDAGVTVPYIVRIERGTMNRGVHDIAVLADPSKAWAPWAPQDQPGWNHKLYIPFGAGWEPVHVQMGPGSVLDDNSLSQGFMVASSSNTQYSERGDDVVSAETVMMLKEHIIEAYGPIRYTQASGGSGGAHQENLHSSNYPGLLQGITPSQHFQDTWTPYREFGDCALFVNFFAAKTAAGSPWSEAAMASAEGHGDSVICSGTMAGRALHYADPTVGGSCENQPWTWSPTNLTGARCTLQDVQIAVFGRRGTDAIDPIGYARRPFDSVGLQYGLVGLNAGIISPAQFVDLNANIGCVDINFRPQAGRCVADPQSVEIAYASGRVTNGHQMANVAMIDLRAEGGPGNEHYDFRTYITRNRLLAANGTAANQAIWRTSTGGSPNAALAFNTMNQWLASIETDTRSVPLAQKIIDDRPTLAVDTCFQGTTPVAQSICDAAYHVYTDTRVAAGEPQTSDYMKCQLKPLNRAGYSVTFTDPQWASLQATFPSGVCDYSKPSVGQVTPQPWQTFADGPGGHPLGDPPVSEIY